LAETTLRIQSGASRILPKHFDRQNYHQRRSVSSWDSFCDA